jgi:hypothetical protein
MGQTELVMQPATFSRSIERPRVAGFLLRKRENDKGGENIVKRILMVLSVAFVMVAMIAATAVPAFADSANWTTSGPKNPNGTSTSGNCAAPGQTCTTTNHGGHIKSVQ